MLPDGCMDLIATPSGVIVAGPDVVAARVRTRPGERRVGLRFAPGVLPDLLGVPADELVGGRESLPDVIGSAAARRAFDAARGPDDVAAIAAALAARARPRFAPPPAVTRLLVEGRSVTEVSDATGIGVRALHRLSLRAYGYGPKTLARILRLQRAVHAMRAGVPLATAAAAAGYADQPHMSRDVRALTGVSPSVLVGSD